MAKSPAQSPVVIAFDGSSAARRALQESAALLAPRPALVVVVWEAGRGFELTDIPSGLLETPPVSLDIRTALEFEDAMYEAAQQLAQHGAALANKAGFQAEGLVVADDVTVADTLIRVATDHGAQAIVIGQREHSELRELLLGSTARAVVHEATCPVVLVREPRQ